jgi:hypothetical protein
VLTGWVDTDGATVTKTAGSYGSSSTGTGKAVTVSLSAGDYAPTGSTLLSNYTLPTMLTGPIGTITPAPLTVTANADSKIYDGAAYSGGNGILSSGFVNGENASVLGGALTYAGTSQGAVNAGSYVIAPGGLVAGNYAIRYVNGVLAVEKAPLTVTADDKSRPYGAANPTLTDTVTGFVHGETPLTAAGFTGAGNETTTAYSMTPVGTAPITEGVGSLAASNYAFTMLVNGTLTIGPFAPPSPSPSPSPAPQPGASPEPVLRAASQIQSELTVFNVLDQHQTLLLSPTIGGEANPYLKAVVVVGNKETRINIGGMGPALTIENGGVKLPANLVIVNE